MVPAVTEGGRSFKGAALYYLHDKRREGEAERLTSDRVAWTHAVNLPTGDPERAWRMMAHTAMSQADLKAAAGEKATGRKLTKPVYAYSLAWHPEQQPDRDHMLSTALDSLKAQGLEGYQAIILAHSDEPQPHVHVLVNRVHPETGKAATLSNNTLKLSKWAEGYEKQHGKIYCDKRVENNRKRQTEYVKEPRKPRAAYEFERAVGNDSIAADFIKANEKQKDAQLYEIGRTIKESHARQWEDLKRVYAGARKKITDHGKTLNTVKAAQIKDSYRERWTMLAQTRRAERRALWRSEDGFLSRLFNGLSLLKEIRQNHEGNAFLIALALMSRQGHMMQALATRHEAERRDLAREIRDVTSREQSQIDKGTRADLDRLRGAFLDQCANLRTTQDKEHGGQRDRWKVRNAERKKALEPYRSRRQRETTQSRDAGRSRGRDRHTVQSSGRRGPGMRPANAPPSPPKPD